MLLVEDDDGDAFLVSELLADVEAPAGGELVLERVETVAAARARLADGADPAIDCVLLDLGLPDADGLTALGRVRDAAPDTALLVLTGDADRRRGVEAVAGGAQDYLVKGRIDGELLARSIRYAIERLRADAERRELVAARVQAEEARRLERGLLPTPLVADPALRIGTGYRPGNRRALLGGDFYDAVQSASGTIDILVGDVCGHGPDEAALGVCLRIAWRTMILGGADADEVLGVLEEVLVHERHDEDVFATMAAVRVEPQRGTLTLRSAGHPPPLVITPADVAPLTLPSRRAPIGALPQSTWDATTVALEPDAAILLYTDGLIEGRAEPGERRRLGVDGLVALVRDAATDVRADPDAHIAELIAAAEAANGAPLGDDLAALALALPGVR